LPHKQFAVALTLSQGDVYSPKHPVTRSVLVGPSGRLRARRKIETV